MRRIFLLVLPRRIGEVSDEVLVVHLDVPGSSKHGNVEPAEVDEDVVLLAQDVEDGDGGGKALQRLGTGQVFEPSVFLSLVLSQKLPEVVLTHLEMGKLD